MTRPSDELKQRRSYTIFFNSGSDQPTVKASHFVPGYTSLHKETPEEAVLAFWAVLEAELEGLKRKLALVKELHAQLEKSAE